MTILQFTRSAKCKDCIFLKTDYKGRRKTYKCGNKLSIRSEQQIKLDDFVCNDWKLE